MVPSFYVQTHVFMQNDRTAVAVISQIAKKSSKNVI